jgi:mannosylfructose-phosphate synthase
MLSTHGYFDPVPELGKTDTGGQVLYILKLARALAKFDIKVDIYTRWFDRGRKQIDPLVDCPSARVIRIPAGDWKFIPKEFIYNVLPELSKNMIEFIQEHNLDYGLFHGHYVDAGIVTLDVAEAFSKPAFFTAHSLGAWKQERTGGDPVEMDKIFNFTHRVKEELRVFKSIKAQTMFRPLGESEKETPTAVDLPDEYVFAVSRISRAKGHDLLLPAFKLVAEKHPDIHLVVAGGSKDPDDEEKEIMAYMVSFIEDNNLKDRVHLIGGVPNPDLPPYYRRAKLFTMAARYEPFGMTALEAMSCQRPIVISKFAGLAENLESGCDCLAVDPNLSLLKDEALMRGCSEKGCLTAREEFSWEAIARKFIAFYDKYLDE